MTELAREMRDYSRGELMEIVKSYDNGETLSDVLRHIRGRLTRLAEEGVWRRKSLD